MHETEKQKVNLIYNHKFKQSKIFYCAGKKNAKNENYTKSFEKQASGKDKRYKTKSYTTA